MALGGGTFLTRNKVLPGAYINFVSTARASAALSDRGYAAVPMELDWGPENEVITVTSEDFIKNSMKYFGYGYDSDKLKNLREIFANANTLYTYRLNGGGKKASNTFAEARYSGALGNTIKTVIETVGTVEEETPVYEVSTYLGTSLVDRQEVTEANQLADNDYVVFKKEAELSDNSGEVMTEGTDGGEVTSVKHQEALNALSGYSFNVLGCPSSEELTKKLYARFTESQRDEKGVKFQTVIYDYDGDYEGIISVPNSVKDSGAKGYELIYWLTGAEAGCNVNESLMNRTYNGEYTVNTAYSQSELEGLLKKGRLVFHTQKGEVRVLKDINSFVSFTADKNSDFSNNQVIRVLDQIGNDIAVIFNDRYMGKVQNDEAGRNSFWADVVKFVETLEDIRAVENFEDSDCTVTRGEAKGEIIVDLNIAPVAAMEKLYMTVYVN